MKMLKNKKALFVVITICILTVFASCKKDDDNAIVYHDNHIFSGGIRVEMDDRDAQKAVKYSLWYDGLLDNYARSVRRAKVPSAEFIYETLPLSGGGTIVPRITFDKDGEVIMQGMILFLTDPKNKAEYERTLESYIKQFITHFDLKGLDEVTSEKADVKQIGEKSVFRKATKLFYDKSVEKCHYWFDKKEKTGYAVYEMKNPDDGYHLAFIQFKY